LSLATTGGVADILGARNAIVAHGGRVRACPIEGVAGISGAHVVVIAVFHVMQASEGELAVVRGASIAIVAALLDMDASASTARVIGARVTIVTVHGGVGASATNAAVRSARVKVVAVLRRILTIAALASSGEALVSSGTVALTHSAAASRKRLLGDCGAALGRVTEIVEARVTAGAGLCDVNPLSDASGGGALEVVALVGRGRRGLRSRLAHSVGAGV